MVDAMDLTEYTGSLNRWLTRSLVRRNMEELTEKLIQLGLRKKVVVNGHYQRYKR